MKDRDKAAIADTATPITTFTIAVSFLNSRSLYPLPVIRCERALFFGRFFGIFGPIEGKQIMSMAMANICVCLK